MSIKTEIVPCPYNLKLEVVDQKGYCTKFTWEGAYVNSDYRYYVSIFKLDSNLEEKSLFIDGVNYSEWMLSSGEGTSPEFDITVIPSANKSGRDVLRYVFKVMAVSGLRGNTLTQAEMGEEDFVCSDVVCHYGSKLPNYQVLRADVEDGNDGRVVPSQTILPKAELTWILDGEPLSGASDMVDELSLVETGRLVGNDISSMLDGELRDGTLNRLAKELYLNDRHLAESINTISQGFEGSAMRLLRNTNRGIVSEIVVTPDTENKDGYNALLGTYPPKIVYNGIWSPVAPDNPEYLIFYSGEVVSTSIEREFSVDLFPKPSLLRPGRKYFVEINFSLNQIYEGSNKRGLREYKSKIDFTFENLAKDSSGNFTSKVVSVKNCVKSYVSDETGAEIVDDGSQRVTGYRVNQYASSFNKCYATIEPYCETYGGVVVRAPTVLKVSAKDVQKEASLLGIYSLSIRVIDIV